MTIIVKDTFRPTGKFVDGFTAKEFQIKVEPTSNGCRSVRLYVDGHLAIENCNYCDIYVDGVRVYSVIKDYEELT